MQTTAIGMVTNSLPGNGVILLTILISKRSIPYTDLREIGDRLPFLLAFAPDMAYLCIAFKVKFFGQRNSLTAVENIFTD